MIPPSLPLSSSNDVGRYRKERDIFRAKYGTLKEQRQYHDNNNDL